MYRHESKIVEESVMILDTLTRRKRPKKLLQQEPKAKKIFKELILNEVKGIKELVEMKKKLNKVVSLNDIKKLFGDEKYIDKQIEAFVEKFGFSGKFDLKKSRLVEERIVKSNLKKKTLSGYLHQKKMKPPEKNKKNDILNLYKQDPTMLVIEFNRNKNLKITKKPSIDNLMQSKFFFYMVYK